MTTRNWDCHSGNFRQTVSKWAHVVALSPPPSPVNRERVPSRILWQVCPGWRPWDVAGETQKRTLVWPSSSEPQKTQWICKKEHQHKRVGAPGVLFPCKELVTLLTHTSARRCPCPSCTALPKLIVMAACMWQENFVMRMEFFFLGIIQDPWGHALPWVFAPTCVEQNIPSCQELSLSLLPLVSSPCTSPRDDPGPLLAPSHSVLDWQPPQTLQVREPHGPRYPKLASCSKV